MSKRSNIIYSNKLLLIIRSITPLHMGSGVSINPYVDVPIQRDEYGFPTIWSSSLKGALKSWLKNILSGDEWRALFGYEPGEELSHRYSSGLALLDARLLLMPVRTLSGIWTYASSPHLLKQYNEFLKATGGGELDLRVIDGVKDKALVSRADVLFDNKVIVNETEVNAELRSNLIEEIGLTSLPNEVLEEVKRQGLIILPDHNNLSLIILDKSILIQYRVRLKRETKTVETGGLWSEEYVPANTVFASVAMIKSSVKISSGEGEKTCSGDALTSSFINALNSLEFTIYVGGKETIGKGLVKIYPIKV